MVDQTGFTNSGLELLNDFFLNNAPSPPISFEFGTGSSPTLPETTSLETKTGGGPHLIESRARLGIGKFSYVVNLGLTEENGKAISELGVYDGPDGDGVDTMYARRTGPPINKTNQIIVRAEFVGIIEDRSLET